MPECLYIPMHPQNPNPRDIDRVVAVLQRGGVVIYPTDTVYGIGCDITNVKAVERVIKLKGLKPKDAHFSFICKDLSNIADFAKVSNPTFKLMKKNLPGPFTFVLPGLHRVLDYFLSKRKTVGIRIPNHQIPLELVDRLGNPILTTSLKDSDEVVEYTTDPELIYENYKHLVDVVIDGGVGGNIPSTIVDCSGDEPIILREGLGELIF
ncbi:MAG: L-threonylcarbamoyladenylate synthase [Tenuifilum sp.]|jgi:tRNA threonylcarbamoyl adenosine modification protein (Sua5/YciO/YrdC/YwlC family)|uniref:L-threonylcarbamoyladenylate synthase n=2 Tax=Tenuifilum sp. TaxID=2760880 RepID=UPI001B6EA58A|nr:threonylcarbamoyl-AMP synthase [Bacteroidales bacterium]HOK62110.1 L-threonylcarbamoyladenylate synthase [Tenuifilum sp.]MBP9030147.1 threonylcarbamoyl-AMP synthase [Bacteroidales bacterium]HOK86862.1 L-threonylcarbamoyladenylate synthase [Tenuifilum sp.]HON71503.1 L-threonylcarbamoyladenylate synthase [Tenuifilum sp.]